MGIVYTKKIRIWSSTTNTDNIEVNIGYMPSPFSPNWSNILYKFELLELHFSVYFF